MLESYLCANCNTPLDVRQVDELHNGEIKVYLIPCPKCLSAQHSVQRTACVCEMPWLPIGGESCERCGGWVELGLR